MERIRCVLYDRECIECGECNLCDLDPTKICDNCKDADHAEQPVSTNALREFLTSLPTEAQRDALVYLSMQLTQGKA